MSTDQKDYVYAPHCSTYSGMWLTPTSCEELLGVSVAFGVQMLEDVPFLVLRKKGENSRSGSMSALSVVAIKMDYACLIWLDVYPDLNDQFFEASLENTLKCVEDIYPKFPTADDVACVYICGGPLDRDAMFCLTTTE